MEKKKQFVRGDDEITVEFRPGVFRKTLSYDRDSMLCRFRMPGGARIALHDHAALQNGFILSGKIRFYLEDGTSFEAGPGDAYVFGPGEKHGSEALEETDFIEFFAPLREEYIPSL